MEKYVLLLGSDLGDRQQHLANARELISVQIGPVLKESSILETAPWGFVSDTVFLNQALLVQALVGPLELLDIIHRIEAKLGRTRDSEQYSSRIIDIDILCAEKSTFSHKDLHIPHLQLQDRAFALVPLCEIASEWAHPKLHSTYSQLLKKLNSQVKLDRV